MTFATGSKIEASDYDGLALSVNRIFSDTSNGSGGPAALSRASSNLILNTTAPITGTGQTFAFTASVDANASFIAVEVDQIGFSRSDYTIDYNANTITFTASLTSGQAVRAYDRYTHTFGWGQEPASVYPHPTWPVDGLDVSRALEANINNLIDKVNIMTDRVGDATEITRIAKGDKIFPNFTQTKGDINTIQSVIDNNVLANSANWTNVLATIDEAVVTVTRSDPWENQLIVGFSYVFPDYNQARYFFNAGGECRLSISMTGDPSDAGYANWVQVVNRMGVVSLKWNEIVQTGEGGTAGVNGADFGFYDLSPTLQTVFLSGPPLNPYDLDGVTPGQYPSEYAANPADYSGLVVQVDARYVEEPSNFRVEFLVTMDDTGFSQDIAGTTTFNAGLKTANAITNNSASFAMTSYLPQVFDDANTSSGPFADN